jgi:hypothetical protein
VTSIVSTRYIVHKSNVGRVVFRRVYSVERHQFIHGYGRERFYIMENNYTITNLQSNTTYYRNNFFNTNTGRFSSTPIVTYDVSDIAVDMLLSRRTTGCASFVHHSRGWKHDLRQRRLYGVRLVAVQHDHLESYSVFNSNTAYGWISKTVLTINKFWKIYRDNRHDSGLWIIHIWRMDSNPDAVLQRRRVVRWSPFQAQTI